MLYHVEVKVSLKESILDPQGKTALHALHSLDYKNVSQMRIGKNITFKIEAESEEEASKSTSQMCEKLLVNPVMEDYTFELSHE